MLYNYTIISDIILNQAPQIIELYIGMTQGKLNPFITSFASRWYKLLNSRSAHEIEKGMLFVRKSSSCNLYTSL